MFISYRIVLWNKTKTYTIWCEHDLSSYFHKLIIDKQREILLADKFSYHNCLDLFWPMYIYLKTDDELPWNCAMTAVTIFNLVKVIRILIYVKHFISNNNTFDFTKKTKQNVINIFQVTHSNEYAHFGNLQLSIPQNEYYPSCIIINRF